MDSSKPAFVPGIELNIRVHEIVTGATLRGPRGSEIGTYDLHPLHIPPYSTDDAIADETLKKFDLRIDWHHSGGLWVVGPAGSFPKDFQAVIACGLEYHPMLAAVPSKAHAIALAIVKSPELKRATQS